MRKETALKNLLEKTVYIAVLSTLFFIPFSKGAVEASVVTGLAAYFLLAIFFYEKTFINQIPLATAFLLYLIAIECSMINSLDFEITTRGLVKALKYLGLYLIVCKSICSQGRLKWVVRIILLAAFLSCLNGLCQKITGWDFRHQYPIFNNYGVFRIRGSFNHPNNFAAYLATSILIVFYSQDRRLSKLVKYFLLLLYFFVLFQTNSRLPVVLLLISLGLASIFSKKMRKISFMAIACVTVIFGIYLIYEPAYLSHMIKMLAGDGRLQYWVFSIDLAKQNPVFGWGVNSFMNIFGQYQPTNMYGDTRFIYAHNFILQMWVEIGLVGLFAFLNLLAQYFVKARLFLQTTTNQALYQSVFGMVIASVFFILHSGADNNLQSLQLSTYFWIIVGCVMGISTSTHDTTSRQSA